MTKKRRARALLIGVESYDNLGSDKQLRAGRNDVLAFWKVCRRLNFAPKNIHVFTSPELEVKDLVWAEQELRDELDEYQGKTEDQIAALVRGWFPPHDTPRVFLSAATREAILGPNGLKWLAQGEKNNGEQPFDRILTYSGHGTTIDKGGKTTLALCPSDLDENNLDSFISIDTFKKELQDVDDNMTVVLDCCFAQSAAAPRGTHRVATLSGATSDKPLEIDASGLGARVFCASGPNESSYQAMLGGYWYSAFSWAMTVALEQWRICRKDKPHSTVTHSELLFRARMLLEALSFPQHPVLLDHLGNRPVFGHLDAAEETSPGPNEEWRNGQIDPNVRIFDHLKFSDNGSLIAELIIPHETKGDFIVGNEYWYLRTAKYSMTTATVTITYEGSNDAPRIEGNSRVFSRLTKWYQTERLPKLVGEYTINGGTVKFGLYMAITEPFKAFTIYWYHTVPNNIFQGSSTEGPWTLRPYDANKDSATWYIGQGSEG